MRKMLVRGELSVIVQVESELVSEMDAKSERSLCWSVIFWLLSKTRENLQVR